MSDKYDEKAAELLRDFGWDVDHSRAVAAVAAALREQVMCDICGGEIEHAKKINCACGGTGNIWDVVHYLRVKLEAMEREIKLKEKEKAEEKTSYLCKSEDPAEHRKCSSIVQGNLASNWYRCACTCHKSEPSSKKAKP